MMLSMVDGCLLPLGLNIIYRVATGLCRAWPSLSGLPSFNGKVPFDIGSLTLCRLCRWVASTTSHRHELLDERRRRPKSQWRCWLQPPRPQRRCDYARPFRLHEQLDLLRSFAVSESAAATTDAKWRNAQWVSSLQQSRLSNKPYCALEETKTKRRQLRQVSSSSAWHASQLALANPSTTSIPWVPAQ